MLQGFLATKLASSLLSQFRSFGKSDIENDYLFLLSCVQGLGARGCHSV